MTGSIFIGSKVVVGDYDHSYLIYDFDGNLATIDDQKVIRGGANVGETTYINSYFELLLEVDVDIEQSADLYDESSETAYTRGSVEVDLNGRNAEDVWDEMVEFAESMGVDTFSTYSGGGSLINTTIIYNLPFLGNPDGIYNSNAFVSSILANSQILLKDNMPTYATSTNLVGQNLVFGGNVSDKLLIGDNVQFINGGNGTDTANFSSLAIGLTVNLEEGDLISGTNIGEITNIEYVIGTQFDDTITGDDGNNVLYGLNGNDHIFGGDGDDFIDGGGGGVDYLYGGAGADVFVWDVNYTGTMIIVGWDPNDIIQLIGWNVDDLEGRWGGGGGGIFNGIDEGSSTLIIDNLESVKDAPSQAPKFVDSPPPGPNPNDPNPNPEPNPNDPESPIPNPAPKDGESPTPKGGNPTAAPTIIPNTPKPETPDKVKDATGDMPGVKNPKTSPLVIDMDGDGIELTSVDDDWVYWDQDNNGFREASAWVQADDALLAFDRNNNGIIDNHSELFGTATVDGFSILSQLDSNSDGKIDANDAEFANLKIWQDSNQDAFSQSSELQSLSDSNIASINLNASTVNYQIEGNDITHTSTVIMTDNSTKTIVDAWFKYDAQNSKFDEMVVIDYRTLDLPNLRGYGSLKDLDLQMSLNEALLSKVQTLSAFSLTEVLNPNIEFDHIFREMLFMWSEKSFDNGSAIRTVALYDDRKVQFLEDISAYEVNLINDSWEADKAGFFRDFGLWQKAISYYQANFLFQTVFEDLFTGTVGYNQDHGIVSGATGLSLPKLSDISTLISASSDKEYSWSIVVKVIEGVIGIHNLTTLDYTALEDAIQVSGYDLETILGLTLGDLYEESGTISDDTYVGTFGDDILSGSSGNDDLTGAAGDDILYGGGGNDIYAGGSGDDVYSEMNGFGDDIYHYYSGEDVIDNEGYGTDKIVMRDGITIDDIYINRIGSSNPVDIWNQSNLVINIAELGSIVIRSQYGYGGYIQGVESIQFHDLSTLNLATLENFAYGTSGNDTMMGADRSYYLNDRIDAADGDDTLSGGMGYNQLIGGNGNDTYIYGGGIDYIYDYDGNDQIVFSSSYDQTKFDFKFDPTTDSYYNTNLSIYYDGELVVVIDRQLHSGGWYAVEKVVIDGVHEFNLATDIDWTQNGTSGVDAITALQAPQIANPIVNGMGGNDYLYGSDKNDTILGGTGDDYLDGRYGNDTLRGEAGADTLYAGYGNDTLYGGDGADTLNGGFGVDTFVFEAASAFNNVDTVMDFNAGQGDVLKISDLLIGYTPGTTDINDFVSFTVSGSNTSLVIDRDGAGTTYNDQSIATLSNVTGLNVDDLFNNNQIVV